ncbi:hypothetical protein V5O48_016880, partial [Marasmius crinis-equi]
YPKNLPRPADNRDIDLEPIITNNPGRYHNNHYSLIRIIWDINEDMVHIETIQHISITEKILPHQAILTDIIPVENLPVTPTTVLGQPSTLTSYNFL